MIREHQARIQKEEDEMGEGGEFTWIDADSKFAKQMQAAGASQHRIAIAVSGGADSMALCLLASRWKRRSSPEVGAAGKCDGLVGFVVDHGLRSGSAEEAIGIAGLAGIASATSFYLRAVKGFDPCQLLLVRPLLKFVKEDLYNICQTSGQNWIEDPTNVNLNFARNRIRKALKGASLRMGTFTVEIEKLLSSGVSNAVLHRAVAALRQFAAQKVKPPRGRAVSSVIEHLQAKNSKGAFTVAGCNVFPAPRSKGSISIICFSPDSPLPSGPSVACLDQSVKSLSSEVSSPVARVPGLSQVDQESPIPDEVITDSLSKAISLLTLDIKTPRTAVDEFKGLGLISDAGARLLQDLASDVSLDMRKSPVNQLEEALTPNTNSTSSQCPKVRLTFGGSEYFMDRFIVSVSSRELVRQGTQPFVPQRDTEPSPGECCLLRQKMWIRHFEEKDWVYMSRLASGMPDTCSVIGFKADMLLTDPQRLYSSNLNCTSGSKRHAQAAKAFTASLKVHTSYDSSSPSCGINSSSDELHDIDPCRRPWYEIERFSQAKEALAKLRSVPKLVRKGLPVIVTTQGLLLGMPSVGYKHCPLASMKAVFCPRIPLGGPQASWL